MKNKELQLVDKYKFNQFNEAMKHINDVKKGKQCPAYSIYKLTNYLASQLNISPARVREIAFETLCKTSF